MSTRVAAGVQTAEPYGDVVKGRARARKSHPCGELHISRKRPTIRASPYGCFNPLSLRISAKNTRPVHRLRWVHALRMVLVREELGARCPLSTERYGPKPGAVRAGLKALGWLSWSFFGGEPVANKPVLFLRKPTRPGFRATQPRSVGTFSAHTNWGSHREHRLYSH